MGEKKRLHRGSIAGKERRKENCFILLCFGQRSKEQRQGRRKVWAGPVTATLTFRKLEKKQIKLPS